MMSKLIEKIMAGPFGNLIQEILHFGVIGVFNTLLGWCMTFGFYNLLHMNYWVASITSYTIGSVISYVLNKKFTFKVEGDTKNSAIRFAGNIIVCYVLAYGIAKPVALALLSGYSQVIQDNVALLVGNVLFVFFNFFGQKFFVFHKEKHNEETQS